MNILFVTEDLVVGGAQVFALRLAQALSKEHNVHLFCYLEDLIIHDIVRNNAPGVKLLTYRPLGGGLLRLIDRMLYKLKVDLCVYNMFVNRQIKRYLRDLKIDIVHSHAFKVDYELTKILRSWRIPWILTTHGDHAVFYRNIKNGRGEQVYNYSFKLRKILERVSFLVYLSDRQLDFIQLIGNIDWDFSSERIVKIYNGFTGGYTKSRDQIRTQLGIADDVMVFGMVARDNPQKGWRECIEAYRKIGKQYNTALVLVGDGDYLNELKSEYSDVRHLHFVGFSPNPVDMIQGFNVGVLPTRDDNLPTTVIEYLFCEKPVIATNIGEIPDMISADGEKAGFTLELNSLGRADSDDLADCMKAYLDDDFLYNKHRALTKEAVSKFDMGKCVISYLNLYNSALQFQN